jgi:hypothetical protein
MRIIHHHEAQLNNHTERFWPWRTEFNGSRPSGHAFIHCPDNLSFAAGGSP